MAKKIIFSAPEAGADFQIAYDNENQGGDFLTADVIQNKKAALNFWQKTTKIFSILENGIVEFFGHIKIAGGLLKTANTAIRTYLFPDKDGTVAMLSDITGGGDTGIFALLAGRTGGQTLIGGTGTTDKLVFRSTSVAGTTGANIEFQVGNNGSIKAMTILNSGFVGIGFNAPIVGLQIGNVAGTFPTLAFPGSEAGTFAVGGVPVGRFYIQGTSQADFTLDHSGAGADLKMFQFINKDGVWRIRSVYDNGNVRRDPILSCSSAGVLGARTMTPGIVNGVDFSGSISIHGFGGNILSESTATSAFLMNSTDFAVDSRMIQIAWLAAGLTFRTMNDAGTVKSVLTTLDSFGRFGIGVIPTAVLHLKASQAGANLASLKIDPGVLATVPASGNIESDGTNLYFTDSTATRKTIGATGGTFLQNNLGLSGGTTLIGGTGTTDKLILRSTSGVGTTGADIVFQTGNNGATEAMRILNTGIVRMGSLTGTFGYGLTVKGSIACETHTADDSTITMQHTGPAGFALLSATYNITGAYVPFVFRTADVERLKMWVYGQTSIGHSLYIGDLTTPTTARLHLPAGIASFAPLKFTAGVNLTTPEGGAVEWDGTNLYITQLNGTRKQFAFV